VLRQDLVQIIQRTWKYAKCDWRASRYFWGEKYFEEKVRHIEPFFKSTLARSRTLGNDLTRWGWWEKGWWGV